MILMIMIFEMIVILTQIWVLGDNWPRTLFFWVALDFFIAMGVRASVAVWANPILEPIFANPGFEIEFSQLTRSHANFLVSMREVTTVPIFANLSLNPKVANLGFEGFGLWIPGREVI